MSVLIIQTADHHSEIFCMYFKLFKHFEFVYPYLNSKMDWLSYYFSKLKKRKVYKTISDTNLHKYKLIILNTALESFLYFDELKEHSEKLLFICHQTSEVKKIKRMFQSPKIIGLCPFFPKYHLPINTDLQITEKPKIKQSFLVIGINSKWNDEEKNIKDLLNFIKELHKNQKKYVLHICSQNINYESKTIKELSKYNTKFFDSPKTSKIINCINQSSFILPIPKPNSIYMKSTLTGSLPIALNFGRTLICPNKFAKIYKLKKSQFIGYKSNLKEVL